MSVDYTAYAVIGVAIPFAKVAGPGVVVPSCEHAQRDGNLFCPVCGKKVEDHRVAPAPYDVEQELAAIAPEGTKVVRPGGSEDKAPTFLMGLVTKLGEHSTNESFAELGDVYTMRSDLKAVLEPRGLWDPEKFGLHAAMEVSY